MINNLSCCAMFWLPQYERVLSKVSRHPYPPALHSTSDYTNRNIILSTRLSSLLKRDIKKCKKETTFHLLARVEMPVRLGVLKASFLILLQHSKPALPVRVGVILHSIYSFNTVILQAFEEQVDAPLTNVMQLEYSLSFVWRRDMQ